MGGDDLGSDDELWTKRLKAEDDDSSAASSNNENNKRKEGVKRKSAIDDKDDETAVKEDKSNKKKKTKQTPERLLLEAGRELEVQDAEQQAAFFNTALSHYSLLSSKGSEDRIFTKLEPHNFQLASGSSLVERLNRSISSKKMRKWKEIGSPHVIIVCISARRAVTILKDLSLLKVRVAKLFPKNGTIVEHSSQLSSTPFGLAIGTPHRLLALCQHDKNGLSLNRTKLIIFDSDISNKQYTVCTLPDTAPHCMELIKDFVLPELKKRQDLKLAFF